MRLYHSPFSANARRAVMTVHQLSALPGAPSVELVNVDLGKGEQRTPTFLAMNPNGKVPVLDDDGFLLTESHAIMQYLAESTPGQTLYPTEPTARRARADVNRWLFWNSHHFQPAIAVLNWERLVKRLIGAGAPDPAEEKRGETLVAQTASVLDAHLRGRTWVSGDTMTLADLALATPLMTIAPARLPVAQYESLLAWHARVAELDAWKRTAG